jgi:ATP-dependent protease ClpP protease subunit
VAALDEIGPDVTDIHLHINSPGGEVFEGITILNALRNHPARVTAVVDGLAASAASFIATGADEW